MDLTQEEKEAVAEVKGVRHLIRGRLKQYQAWQSTKFNALTLAKIEELKTIDGFFKALALKRKVVKEFGLETNDEEI